MTAGHVTKEVRLVNKDIRTFGDVVLNFEGDRYVVVFELFKRRRIDMARPMKRRFLRMDEKIKNCEELSAELQGASESGRLNAGDHGGCASVLGGNSGACQSDKFLAILCTARALIDRLNLLVAVLEKSEQLKLAEKGARKQTKTRCVCCHGRLY